METFDLSALLGPQPIIVSREQFATITERFPDAGGFELYNDGAGTVTVVPIEGTTATLDPTLLTDAQAVVDVRGGFYPRSDFESYGDAIRAAAEATKDVLDAVEQERELRDSIVPPEAA